MVKEYYNVLSLFGGMECGRIALDKENIPVGNYYSSEIDKYAMQIANKNYPDIIQLGDVTKWREWNIDFSSIDLLLAGFPCQARSMAGKQKGDSDPRGALVHDLIDIWNEIKKHNPNVKFLFENVRMKKKFKDYVDNLFGIDHIVINSSLVSAQNRVRWYWTNIPGVTQPEDRKIYLKDIFEKGIVDKKYFVSEKQLKRINFGNAVIGGVKGCFSKELRNTTKSECLMARDYKGIPGKQDFTMVLTQEGLRKLTVKECERLQTLPNDYTAGVSNTQRYKMIGNGWTIDIICHLFKGLKTTEKGE